VPNIEPPVVKKVHVRRGKTFLLVSAGGVILVLLALIALEARRSPRPRSASFPQETPSAPLALSAEAAVMPQPGGDGAVRHAHRPSPSSSAAQVLPAGDKVVFFSPWGGSSLNQLGRDRPSEGNPEGPMSVSVDRAGRVVVLDQVNGRLVTHGPGGEAISEIKLGQRLPQDVAVGSDGAVAVLDRFGSKAVGLYDEHGSPRGELPLVGPGVEKPGEITGVMVDGKDVYVEREHGPLVLLGSTSGEAAGARTELPGRPSRDGLLFLSAGISSAPQGRLWVSATTRATREHRFTRELRLGAQVSGILMLDSDRAGTIYIAAEVERGEQGVVVLTCLEPQRGATIGTAELPANTMPEETFRDMVVQDDGGVVYAVRSEQGVTYARASCR
jgi:hypothetical protein